MSRGAGFRLSGAVLLTRGDGDEREVFLVERAPTLSFFGGYWAIPGGVVDPEDWNDPELAGDPVRVGSDDGHEERTIRRCALRELHEEVGVRVDGSDPLGRLQRLGRVTTPPFARVRYRATYYHLEAPLDQTPNARTGELTAGEFVRPAQVLDEWRRGARRLVPPLVTLFETWARVGFDALAEEFGRACLASEAGRLYPARATPGVGLVPLATPTIPPATTTNCYLVGERSLWIVDPATYEESERERLYELLERMVASGRELSGVLVTHHHPDHVGSVAAVSQRYNLKVRAHPLTLDRLPPGFQRGAALNDGDTLELGFAPDGSPDWKLTAHHTPGHDRGHLVFVDSRYRGVIAGDLVSTLSTIVIDPPEGHLATYIASLERVRAMPIGAIHPAHGPVHPEGRKLLGGYLEHRRQREQQLLAALDSTAQTPRELVRRVYTDEPPDVLALAERSLLAGLEKLEEEGRAQRQPSGWVRA